MVKLMPKIQSEAEIKASIKIYDPATHLFTDIQLDNERSISITVIKKINTDFENILFRKKNDEPWKM